MNDCAIIDRGGRIQMPYLVHRQVLEHPLLDARVDPFLWQGGGGGSSSSGSGHRGRRGGGRHLGRSGERGQRQLPLPRVARLEVCNGAHFICVWAQDLKPNLHLNYIL